MLELRAAVVGAGRLGSFHAQKYRAMAGVKLAHVVDINREHARRVASENGAEALVHHGQLKGRVDLASVTASSSAHFKVAADLLRAGIDVLIEKPMTATVGEARKLVSIAHASGRILQVGHLERFNPAIIGLRAILKNPRFVECDRLAPFTERGTDVDVILDLMIHDIDVIVSLTGADVVKVEATGVAVLTDTIDVATAHVRFSNRMVGNLNSSRVAPRRQRKIRFFQPDAYISVDYEERKIQIYRKSAAPSGKYPTISAEQIDFEESDALADEIASFVNTVRTRGTPAVTALDGLRALEICEKIKAAMEAEDAASTE
ncbi:MAG TPA: Gfo/Idh/MocA family oxidoreductase [Candidatus Binataceae bacterium]|jgi:predicted dehydrogenase